MNKGAVMGLKPGPKVKVPKRVMVSFSETQMQILTDEARRQERSVSYVVNKRAFPDGTRLTQVVSLKEEART